MKYLNHTQNILNDILIRFFISCLFACLLKLIAKHCWTSANLMMHALLLKQYR